MAFLVIGHDLTVTLCAEGGQLAAQRVRADDRVLRAELTADADRGGADTLTERGASKASKSTASGAKALVRGSIGLVTALVPTLGYEASSRVARRALAENRSVAEIVLDERLLTEGQLTDLLQVETMTGPSRAKPAGIAS